MADLSIEEMMEQIQRLTADNNALLAERENLKEELSSLRDIDYDKDRFVVVTPMDNMLYGILQSNGPMAHEQQINKADLAGIITRAKKMESYGTPMIFKLVLVGTIEQAEDLLSQQPL